MRILPLHPLTVLCELYVLMSCLVMNDWLELESDLIFSVLYSCISNIETLPGIRFESSLSNADICSKVNLTGIFLFFFFFLYVTHTLYLIITDTKVSLCIWSQSPWNRHVQPSVERRKEFCTYVASKNKCHRMYNFSLFINFSKKFIAQYNIAFLEIVSNK